MDKVTEVRLMADVVKDRWRETVSRDDFVGLLTSSKSGDLGSANAVRLIAGVSDDVNGVVFGGKSVDQFERWASDMAADFDAVSAAALLCAGAAFAERLIFGIDDPSDEYAYAGWFKGLADNPAGLRRRWKQDEFVSRMFTKRGGEQVALSVGVNRVCRDAVVGLEVVEKALSSALNAL